MPVLQPPARRVTVDLPPRKALLASRADVLVVGGGPAGLGAAAGAAMAGARTLLVERHGFLGGNATAALVMPLMSYHTYSPAAAKPGDVVRFFPHDHGPGDPVIAGVLSRLLEKLVRNGGAIPPSLATGYVVPFDPEIFKFTALELMDELGVQMLFHSFASSLYREGDHTRVVLETKSGPLVIEAGVVVD
ncbi:MAG: FAD-dependent oxidoreductase, partial [Bacteroidetes bacterium]